MLANFQNTPLYKKMTQGHSAVLAERQSLLGQSLYNSQNALLLSLKEKESTLKIKISQLLDFGPQRTTDLKASHPMDEAKKLIQDLHELKVQLVEIQVEIKIAEETYKELFEDEESKDEESKP